LSSCGEFGLGPSQWPVQAIAVSVPEPEPMLNDVKPVLVEKLALKLPMKWEPSPRCPSSQPCAVLPTSTAFRRAWKLPGGVVLLAISTSPLSDPTLFVLSYTSFTWTVTGPENRASVFEAVPVNTASVRVYACPGAAGVHVELWFWPSVLALKVAETRLVLAGLPESAIAMPAAASAITVALASSTRRPARGKSVLIESSLVEVVPESVVIGGRFNEGRSSDDLRAVFSL